jgi:hypothetical protein
MTIQIRRDTAANWTSANPTLAAGQPGYETDTGRIKIGNGSTAWTSLPYRFESGSLTDGDKGDITVASSGTSWTIDANAVTLSKMADLATSTILGRVTAGTGDPEALTPAQVRTLLNVADGANNYTHPNHTGDVTSVGDGATTIAAGAVSLAKMANLAANSVIGNNTGSAATPIALTAAQVRTLLGLATIATSGSASDLSAGTLPAARFDDTAHGTRGGGTLHPAATTSVAGFMSAADKTKLDGVATGANNYVHPNHTGDVTSVGDGATTIAADAVTNTKLANMATATLKGRATAGTGDPEDLTGTQATALLDTFTTSAKGLAPASGGGTTNFLRADGTWAAPPGGGGGGITALTGDVSASGTGSVTATISADAVDNTKLANMAANSLKGNNTGGAADPADLTTSQVKTMLAITSADISNFGSAARAALTDYDTTATSGGTTTLTASSKDVQLFTGTSSQTVVMPVVSTLSLGRTFVIRNSSTSTLTVQSSGGTTIGSTIGGNMDATFTVIALTGTDDTPWLWRIGPARSRTGSGAGVFASSPTFSGTPILAASATTGASLRMPHGTAPTSPVDGDLWTTTAGMYVRVNGATVGPLSSGGSGSPGGSTGEIQYNNAGAFAGATDAEIEGGQLRLPAISTPTAPASGGLKFFGGNNGNGPIPAYLGPLDVAAQALQTSMAEGHICWWTSATGTALSVWGWPAATAVGTITAATTTVGSRRARMKRVEYLVTTAATTAIASWRINSAQYTINGGNSWEGGFRSTMHGGPSTGVTNGSHRFFMGLYQAAAVTDVNPSTLVIMAGVGYDAADTQVQFMTNDSTGTATKVALGASFPKPNADRSFTYRLRLYAPPGTTRRLYYEVTYLETGAVATGSVTTDLPATTDLLAPICYASVGGVSSVVGIAVGPMFFQTEPF